MAADRSSIAMWEKIKDRLIEVIGYWWLLLLLLPIVILLNHDKNSPKSKFEYAAGCMYTHDCKYVKDENGNIYLIRQLKTLCYDAPCGWHYWGYPPKKTD
jgi:hypothetical protein